MAATYRVEWLAVDDRGDEHHYVSHEMRQSDAQAMAATLRMGGAADVQVLDSKAVHRGCPIGAVAGQHAVATPSAASGAAYR